jgi:outer membrane protein assembly factor BamE
MAIEQGNILKPEKIAQLELGMSKSQVEFILGTPIIKDTFNKDRWDYVHSIDNNIRPTSQKNLILLFKDDHLTSFSGNALDDNANTAADKP